MAHAPLIYVVAERNSPGFFDVIMPGTFRSPAEEKFLLERLIASPPAVVVWSRQPFDNLASRGLKRSAPRLSRWVAGNYRAIHESPRYRILIPKAAD